MRFDGRASRDEKKARRAERVAAIVVVITREDGTALPFDGDEQSQERLDRFARRARATGLAALPWVLADNTVVEVTPQEMEQALDAALRQQGNVWFL